MIACLKTCLHLSHRNCIVMEISFSYIFFCEWVVHALLSYMYVSPLNFSKLLCIKHTRYKHINDPHALQVTTNKNHKFKSSVLQLTYPHLNAVRLEWYFECLVFLLFLLLSFKMRWIYIVSWKNILLNGYNVKESNRSAFCLYSFDDWFI